MVSESRSVVDNLDHSHSGSQDVGWVAFDRLLGSRHERVAVAVVIIGGLLPAERPTMNDDVGIPDCLTLQELKSGGRQHVVVQH